jgi:hypothetical protein
MPIIAALHLTGAIIDWLPVTELLVCIALYILSAIWVNLPINGANY